jgi:hypothetical protein
MKPSNDRVFQEIFSESCPACSGMPIYIATSVWWDGKTMLVSQVAFDPSKESPFLPPNEFVVADIHLHSEVVREAVRLADEWSMKARETWQTKLGKR